MFQLFSKKETGKEGTAHRIYLDHASATPMTDTVLEAMKPYWQQDFGNAAAIHKEGVAAKRALESARRVVARTLGVQESGVVFTSGGTESNNLALIGSIEAVITSSRPYTAVAVAATAIEHPATTRAVAALATRGVTAQTIPVHETGAIDLQGLRSVITKDTVIVSISYVNSEVGTIADCRAVRRVLDEVGKGFGTYILLHVDAAQAPLWLPCDLPRLGADLLSLDAGKCGGPKGCGVLAWQKGVTLAPTLFGGGQEAGLRPGTEPLPLIVGTATAITEAQHGWKERSEAVSRVRDYFLTALPSVLPQAVVNGALGAARVANNVHISMPGLDSEYAVIVLDAAGIAASTKSACSSKGGGESVVVQAMTGDSALAASTLRFTLGAETTTADIDTTLRLLQKHIAATPLF